MINKEIFKDKNIFISGASGSIGSCLAMNLASYDCKLFLSGRNKESLEKLKDEIKSLANIEIELCILDLSRLDEVNKFTKSFKSKIDVLVNCAGMFPVSSITEMRQQDYIKVMNINLHAPYLLSRLFSQKMIKSGWGRIVNIGSISAYNGYPNTSAYCSSKHGLLGMSRSMHEELKDHNVRVFCISPSSTKGAMGLSTKGQDYNTFLDPQEVTDYVLFCIAHDGAGVSPEILIKRMVIR
jgi:short-subunit dehydrogenase